LLGWLTRRRSVNAPQRLVARGAELERGGRLAEACDAYRAAIEADPRYVPGFLNLGVALEALGLESDAERAYRAALAIEPANPFAAFNLGKLAFGRAQLAEAQSRLDAALRAKPDFAEAQVVLAAVHEARGDAPSALECLEAALRARPGYGGALHNLGLLLARLGRWAQAEAALREAVAADPNDAEALLWRGTSLYQLGRPDEAISCLTDALRARPDSADAHAWLGNALFDANRRDEARRHFERAVALEPRQAEAHAGLGNVLAAEKLPAQAAECYARALELDPRLLHARINLGNSLAALGRTAEACRCLEAAVELAPESAEARWCLAMSVLPPVRTTAGELPASRAAFARQIDALDRWFDEPRAARGYRVVGLRQPFWLTYQDERNADLLRDYGRLCARLMSAWPDRPPPPPRVPRGRRVLRVGVVSQFFRRHSVWDAVVKGWFACLDRREFELHAFSLGADEDAETRSARETAARFESGPRPLGHWVECIQAARPDVLLYPEIGMDQMCVRLAALRLAPVQATTWGHPETSGLPTVDYYLSAQCLEPEGAQANYTETLVMLPNLGCHLEPEADLPPADVASLGLETNVPLLVCPGTPYKYAPEHDDVFPRIARELGDCRFVFFSYWTPALADIVQRRLAAAFARHGLDSARFVRVLPWLPRRKFLGLLRGAHAYLDTIGFSGINTALHAIQCGLVPVTREGRFLRGRLAAGLLRRLGAPELIAASDDEYVDRAVQLCRDGVRRDAARRRLSESQHLLFGDEAPIRALEAFLRRA